MLYQRKPEIVEARQHQGPRLTVIHDELGQLQAHAGDWLVGNERGKVRVMTNEQFQREFEPVPPTPPAKSAKKAA